MSDRERDDPDLTIRERIGLAILRRVLRPAVVDLLPTRLWRSGNLYWSFRLHFCYDPYRTVEWDGNEIARGRRLLGVPEHRPVTGVYPCPVCGFGLERPPWTEGRFASGSHEICPSCGIQFGYNDAAGGRDDLRPLLYARWRERWIVNGRHPLSPGPPFDDLM